MSDICDDINQTDQIRFWLNELTALSPKQIEKLIEKLKIRTVKPSLDRLIS